MRTFQYRLQQKMDEVFFLEPADLGPAHITHIYKMITSFLKSMPFLYIVPLSFLLAFFIYILLGPLIVKLVSLLQYGF